MSKDGAAEEESLGTFPLHRHQEVEMGSRSCALAMFIASLSAACFERLEIVTLTSASDPTFDRTFGLVPHANPGAGAPLLFEVSGDVGSISYEVTDKRRIYLFGEDIETGVASGKFLQLPLPAMSMMPTSITLSDPAFQSFRTYDVGECGGSTDWMTLGATLAFTVDAVVFGHPHVHGGSRTSPILIDPVLRVKGGDFPRSEDDDSVRLRAVYHAAGVGGLCNDVTINLDLTFGVVRKPGVISRPPRTPAPISMHSPSCTERFGGSTGQPNDGLQWDFEGEVRHIHVDLSDPCILDWFTGQMEQSISASVRGIVADQIKMRTFVDPLLLDADDRRFCTCDEECNSESVLGPFIAPGRRHRCIFSSTDPHTPAGLCGVQLEADRVLLRPEGVEIVLSEDRSDFQDAFFDRPLLADLTVRGQQCGTAIRGNFTPAGADPTSGMLPFPMSFP